MTYKIYLMHFVVLGVLLVLAGANICHYSCATCTGDEYVSCLSCQNRNNFAETVEDPAVMPAQYWSSYYPSGTCIQTFAASVNGLGLVVFLVIVGVCMFLRTKESFYLLLTFQTYGLYNLVQIAWVNPLGFTLQSFQYLMIFNTIGYGYKNEDYVLVASKNYRLNKYLQTTNIGQNIILLAVFTLIPLIILIIISIIALRKEKTAGGHGKDKDDVIFQSVEGKSTLSRRQGAQEKDIEKDQNCYCWKHFSEQVLIKIAKFLLCFLFLMVQQTCLILLVSLVYVTPVDSGIIALCIIYLHILVFIMSYSYYYRIQYFKTKKIMYLSFAQKVVLPIMVVVPLKYQYVFFIFAAGFLVLEFLFDYINGLYKQFNRLAVYKVVEAVTIVMLIIYFLVQKHAGSYSSSRAAGITCTFVQALNLFIFVAVEVPVAIKEKYFPSKEVDEEIEAGESQNEAVLVIQEDTLDNIDGDKNANKAVVMVKELDSEDNSDNSDNDNGSEEQEKNGNGLNGIGGLNNGGNVDAIDEDTKNSSIGRGRESKATIEAEQVPKPSPAKKKRRKQIIDPELRLRYGI